MPLISRDIAAAWMVLPISFQYSLAQFLAVCWALFLAALSNCDFFWLGDLLCSVRTVRLASMTWVTTENFALNQSCVFVFLFPKVAKGSAINGVPQCFPLLRG